MCTLLYELPAFTCRLIRAFTCRLSYKKTGTVPKKNCKKSKLDFVTVSRRFGCSTHNASTHINNADFHKDMIC